MVDFSDSSEYSQDGAYRWWYERRWDDGPALCWVGLNPSTGDTSGRPRPTLRKVVARAMESGLSAVVVVNLFSWRATNPRDLKLASRSEDVIGDRTDEAIRRASSEAALTLAAWGANGSFLDRGAAVADMLENPLCLGLTRGGQPLHPLYVKATAVAIPFAIR